jgi:GntR family transcriptional regulator
VTRHPRAVGGSAGDRDTVARRVHDLLRTDLRDGVDQDRPYVEHEVVAELHASREAVRQALRRLAEQGLLTRRPGRGTVASQNIHSLPLTDVAGGTLDVLVSKVDDRTVRTSPEVAQALGTDSPVVGLVQHVFAVGAEVIGTRWAYYHPHIHQPELTDARCPDLESAFRVVFSRELAGVRAYVDAEAADARMAKRLGIREGDPVVTREELLVDVDGTPQEWAFATYRADHVAFRSRTHTPQSSSNFVSNPS